MQPLVPYYFEPPASDWESAHLEFQDVEGGQKVSWPLVGASLFLPGTDISQTFEEIEANNKGKFRAHGMSGFSLGNYHEFLIWDSAEKPVAFMMGDAEVTFGQVTPLAIMLFWRYHDNNVHSEWEYINSLRILGVSVDDVEAAFISACATYNLKFGITPQLYPLFQDYDYEYNDDSPDDHQAHNPETLLNSKIITAVGPLRFYYNGLLQSDDAAACIYFYRVLEYFSFLTNAQNIKKIRHDKSLTDAEFPKRILELITRDEKGPIFQLIKSVLDDTLIARAKSERLIADQTADALCKSLYSLRNSIVHGKFSYGYTLRSGSVLDEDPQLRSWKSLLRDLAFRALDQYGTNKT